jgi:hypothetical protein
VSLDTADLEAIRGIVREALPSLPAKILSRFAEGRGATYFFEYSALAGCRIGVRITRTGRNVELAWLDDDMSELGRTTLRCED